MSIPEKAEEPAPAIIVGAGIVGLVLALAMKKHCGITVEVYEKASAFHDDVGAGMGMYPNGLRVIRDISSDLLQQVESEGYPYLFRRWERHDGTEVAVANESALTPDDAELQPVGIRRWRLQKTLYQAVIDAGITVRFGMELKDIQQNEEEGLVTLEFSDGTCRQTRVLLGADGTKSRVRSFMTNGKCRLHYSGTTCLMGTSTTARQERGICLPASVTTKCHGAFYPTGETEQCFQFHFPTPKAQGNSSSWGGMTHLVSQEECSKLADRLRAEGWDEKFLLPLQNVDKALKIGFSTLEPGLKSFTRGRIALVGDAAHPPVPYLGQGAQQGLEDAGTLTLLIRKLCCADAADGVVSWDHLSLVFKLYNHLRIDRTADIVDKSHLWGRMQQKRSENSKYNRVKEEKIRRDVFYHETLEQLLPAVRHDYQEEVLKALKEEPLFHGSEEKKC